MYQSRKILGKLTISNYPRQIQLSKAQRPKYWEWNDTTIKSGSKKLLQKYINQKYRNEIIRNNGNILPQWLKDDYTIIGFKGDKEHYNLISVNKQNHVCYRIGDELTKAQNRKPLKYFLCKKVDGWFEKVLANPTQAGTPKMHIISGQDFHVGLNPHIRTKLVDTLHEFYYDYFSNHSFSKPTLDDFREILSKNYPVMIEMEIRDTVKSCFDNTKEGNGKHWDVGNRALPYMKTFLDFLDKGHKDILPFIVDDDRLHVSSGNNAFFTPIEEHEPRQLVFYFYSDTRSIFKKYLDLIKEKLK